MLFRAMIGIVLLATVSNLLCHFYIAHLDSGFMAFYLAVYFFRDLYHMLLFLSLSLYVQYQVEFLGISGERIRWYRLICVLGLFFIIIATVMGHILGYGFVIEPTGMSRNGLNIFGFGFLYYLGILMYTIFAYRDRIIRPILRGVVFSVSVSVLIMGLQGVFRSTSLTTAAFLLPLLALMYLIHSSPYDLTTGAVSEQAFNDMVRNLPENGRSMVFLVALLKGFEGDRELPVELKISIFHFSQKYARDGILFKLGTGRLLFAFDEEKNPNVEEILKQMHDGFMEMYDRFRINYRCLIMESREEISRQNEYQNLIRYLEPQMGINTIYRVTDEEIENYTRHKFILKQLEDIGENMDLDDERILVYCQPVYNVATGEYDTAEALMRMELPELGFIFPDQFIPLAEQSGMIHALSLIILNKTCREISRLMRENYQINRISVNFSILEVRDDSFCDDIIGIIRSNRIPYEKVAIELTESRNATDFEMVKQKVNILKDLGIKFYLDDFGTGYSNFDRIMELPVDIIKFDRSLVIESSKDKDSEYMVYTFADMFNKLNYHVLYEGIETPSDERRCIRMFAQYLQGYKYSKPIPIERLREFLTIESEEERDEAV